LQVVAAHREEPMAAKKGEETIWFGIPLQLRSVRATSAHGREQGNDEEIVADAKAACMKNCAPASPMLSSRFYESEEEASPCQAGSRIAGGWSLGAATL
jgi:hypothetical protein